MRKVTSVMLAISLIILLVTVVAMVAGHEGREGEHRGKGQMVSTVDAREMPSAPPAHRRPEFFPEGLHMLAGAAVLIFGTIHLFYNSRALLSYMGIKPKRR